MEPPSQIEFISQVQDFAYFGSYNMDENDVEISAELGSTESLGLGFNNNPPELIYTGE